MDSHRLHRAGALYLAVAILELFPKVQIVTGEGTSKLLFVDCVFPFPFAASQLPLVEERFRLLLKEKLPLICSDMMPRNAAQLLDHQEQRLLAQELKNCSGDMVCMYRIGGHALYFPFDGRGVCAVESGDEQILSTCSVSVFLHQEVHARGQHVIRVCAVMGSDRKGIKQQGKELALIVSHQQIARDHALLSPLSKRSEWVWQPSGERIKESLIGWWQHQMRSQGFSMISFASLAGVDQGEKGIVETYLEYLSHSSERKVAAWNVAAMAEDVSRQEGFLSSEIGMFDRAAIACSDENFLEEFISSLQFILQISKILCFEYEVVVSVSLESSKGLRSQRLAVCEQALEKLGQKWRVERVSRSPYVVRVETRISDALGRQWVGAFVGMPTQKQKHSTVIFLSLCYSLERIVALLLETKREKFPFEFLENITRSKDSESAH